MNELDSETFVGSFQSIDEYTLTANQLLEDWKNKKMVWKYESGNGEPAITSSKPEYGIKKVGDQTSLEVKPMSIRTFIVTPV